MLLGEAEILGQVRDAYQIALDRGETGPVLNRMFQAALEVGKRVRNETELGTRPVSVAFSGVKLAERIFGKLNNHRALIVGAGATSEQVVRHLCDRGIKKLRVLNRTPEHAVDLATRFGGEVVPWENLASALDWPDLIVTSVSAGEPILTRAIIERAMTARGNRALLLIDLGVPRNVASDVADVYNTYLYNIDDLTEIVEQNKKARVAEIPRAEAIIDEQVEKFLHWQAGVSAGAVLGDLRQKLGAEREAFVQERLASMAHLSEADRAQVSAMLQEFLDRVVLSPAERMRGIPELRRKLQNFEAIRDLFRLDREKP
jgi:glutamyl-tRNA reductase